MNRYDRLWVMILCLVAMSGAGAATQSQYDAEVAWATSAEHSLRHHPDYQVDVTDYCVDATCQAQVMSPPTAGMSSSQINDQKGAAYLTDEGAQSVQASFDRGRPDVRSDPDFEYALIGQQNAFEITHGISNEYVDCETGTQCRLDVEVHECERPTGAVPTCRSEPLITFEMREATHNVPGQMNTTDNGNRISGVYRTQLASAVELTGVSFSKKLLMRSTSKFFYLKINEQTVIQDFVPFSFSDTYLTYFEGYYPISPPLPAADRFTFSTKNSEVWFFSASGYYVTLHFTVPDPIIEWDAYCDNVTTQCEKREPVCVDSNPTTREVDGESVTLPCWAYETRFDCHLQNTCGPYETCELLDETCALQQLGACVLNKERRECEYRSCRETSLQCGVDTFCLDGDCYADAPALNNDFESAVAPLAALGSAAEGISDPPLIFSGKAMACSKARVGFSDCCKDSGWGNAIGLADCSDDERALGQAKEEGLTIYVGDYCAEKVLSVCIREKKSYCTYDSKLAKIIQEQGGMAQLGLSLGGAKSPDCFALTPEQLAQIHFEHIDFSAFYGDIYDDMVMPDAEEIKQRIQSNLGGW